MVRGRGQICFLIHDPKGSTTQERGESMKNRIVVLKKGVEKKQVVEGLCCIGGFVPYLWG